MRVRGRQEEILQIRTYSTHSFRVCYIAAVSIVLHQVSELEVSSRVSLSTPTFWSCPGSIDPDLVATSSCIFQAFWIDTADRQRTEVSFGECLFVPFIPTNAQRFVSVLVSLLFLNLILSPRSHCVVSLGIVLFPPT